jgi:hypothetical protein
VPTLPGSDEVESAGGEAGRLGTRRDIVYAAIQIGAQSPRLDQHCLRRIDPHDATTARREAARQGSRPRSEIGNALVRQTDSDLAQAVEEGIGKTGAMTPVVFRGSSEVRFHERFSLPVPVASEG